MNDLAINQLTTLRWNLQEDVRAYHQRGIAGIGLYRPKLEDLRLSSVMNLLTDYNMKVTSLSWVGGFTGSDGRGFEEAVSDALVAITHAANLRAGTLIILAGGRNNHIRRHATRSLGDALKKIVVVAEEFGVRVSLEPIHAGCGSEWSFVNDIRSTLEMIERVNSPQLGIVLDTYHVGMDEDLMECLPDIVDHLHLLQLGDGRHTPMGEMNRCLLGTGSIPIVPIVHEILGAGYEGPIEVEILGEDVESLSYAQILDHSCETLKSILKPVVS